MPRRPEFYLRQLQIFDFRPQRKQTPAQRMRDYSKHFGIRLIIGDRRWKIGNMPNRGGSLVARAV